MSYNQNFYNNFHGNTFQNAPQFLPPPPAPPPYFIPPQAPWGPNANDATYVRQFEANLPRKQNAKPKTLSISAVRDEICSLLLKLKELKKKESMLSVNINDLSDEDWNSNIQQIEEIKLSVNKILANINNLDVEVLQKLVTKRLAKRSRLKRLCLERKKEKDEWIKEMQEKSRKIDEKLQKIQDDIRKAKEEEEGKIQADMILKETLRKKHDAKRFVVKLDALMRLRRARHNTARGRGQGGRDLDAHTFNNNIEKLKTLWKQRLSMYDKEEGVLRSKLEAAAEDQSKAEAEGLHNLAMWRECLFGGGMPQVDFSGDVARFISVRCQWDEFVRSDGDGTSLPVGWVPPTTGAFVLS